MSTGDDETVILHLGDGVADGRDEHEPGRSRSIADRAVALPAAVAVAAVLIVVTVVGSSLAHKHSGSPTWVTGPAAGSPAPPSPGVSVLSQPVSPSTYSRESLAATRAVPVAPPTTTKAPSSPTAKPSPSKSATPTPTKTPTPTCTPVWPHTGCGHHHHH
jgi:hypothetical protein